MNVSPNSFTCANTGNNTVTLIVNDNNGNSANCTATALVEDNVGATALCQNATVMLDGDGAGSLSTNDVDNGSTDACGIASYSLLPNTFSCADVGPVIMTLQVTDNHSNVSQCTAEALVQDNISPTAICQDAVSYTHLRAHET